MRSSVSTCLVTLMLVACSREPTVPLPTGRKADDAPAAADESPGEDPRSICMREHPAAPEYQPVVRALCAELHDLGAVSASVAIAVDDEIVFSTAAGPRCFGRAEPLRPTTVLGIGSTTKLISTVLALEVAEREGLSLDAPLRAALPEFSDAPSLRDLLSHTAGLRDPEPMVMLERGEQWPALLAERRASPGSHLYANANFLLVGRWLEHTTGRPFAEQYAADPALAPIREHVTVTIDPSAELSCGHMKSKPWTAFDPSEVPPLPAWTIVAGGGLASATSLARLPFALEDTGRLPAMLERRVPSDRPGWDYGLGIRVRAEGEEQVLAHTGNTGTYWAELRWSPHRRISVAVLSSTPQAFEATVLAAFTAEVAKTPKTPKAPEPSPKASPHSQPPPSRPDPAHSEDHR